MNRRRLFWFMSLLLLVSVVAWTAGDSLAKKPITRDDVAKKLRQVTPTEKKEAAQRAREAGILPGVAGVPDAKSSQGALRAAAAPMAAAVLPPYADPGGVPHYFGPYGNWAFSPLPKGPILSITVDNGGAEYSATPTVTILDAYGTGSGASAKATVDTNPQSATFGQITAITIDPGKNGSNYSAPFVEITDTTGTGAVATPNLDVASLTGGLRKFVDKMPGLGSGQKNLLGQYIPVAVKEPAGQETYANSDYYEIALVEYTEKMHSDLQPTRLRGYVQLSTTKVPGASIPLKYLNGQPIYKSDGKTPVYAVDKPHYLGPTIVAASNRAVRIKFYNLLPTGPADSTGRRPGDLFIPVDETVAGSGLGPAGPGVAGSIYTQNRHAVHLHGNNTVWISDGTPHQWITPANEDTPYPQGVSVRNVPDMNPATVDSPTDGMMTIYYTNAMSARLMFYHDHAMGITRLGVYAGGAAGYLVTDDVEKDMINGTNVTGVNPGFLKVLPDLGIPLVVQDKTFVQSDTIFAQDPTWNWGTGPRDANGNITAAVDGDLWYPHVYMTVQNPWDITGTNAFGRWHYGPWFNPPVPECIDGLPVGCIEVGPVANPYANTAAWETPLMPGSPNPSSPGESFLDTPMVNGTAYPYLEVEPKAYRFRILNAANDRFFNLQLYVAADKTTPTTPNTTGTRLCDGSAAVGYANCTEVKMVPVSVAPANQFADTPSGIPDPLTKGPDWIQIGTEGGFLPAPVVIPSKPVGWNLNPAFFNFGVVNQHSLFLGAAERADVVVDFSKYAGKTLILYNDSPAPVPAGAPVYDYYTGNASQMDTGGAPTTQPGYGPNTRTIMQIRVANSTPAAAYDVNALKAVFAKKTGNKRGVFEASQPPILIPQAAYSTAYDNTNFPKTVPEQYVQIADTEKTFKPIDATGSLFLPPVTIPLEMKAMHDEMGGVYDTQFGRMSGMLGLSLQNSPNHVLIPYGYASPPTEVLSGSLSGTLVGSLGDGTQIWRIFHNGVDTHPIHVHLFNAQLINRLGQDGALLPPEPNELGWKDTFRVNPLEITYLAMRPFVPSQSEVPFEVPDSVRLIDPTLPEGASLYATPPAGWFGPDGVAINEILNHYVNFGWEYVWHCHILSHEEMDMMHSLVFAMPPKEPTNFTAAAGGTSTNRSVTLNWTDNSLKEEKFTILRASDQNFTTGLRTFDVVNPSSNVPSAVTFRDTTVSNNTKYWYKLTAIGGIVGDTQAYPGSLGFPTKSSDSAPVVTSVQVGTAPAKPVAPTNLAATLQAGPQVSLVWRDNSTNETGFVVERCSVVAPATSCTDFVQIGTKAPRTSLLSGNVTPYIDATVTAGNSYLYRVAAVNGGGMSAYVTLTSTVVVPVPPSVPSSFTVAITRTRVIGSIYRYTATLKWTYSGSAPTGFTIERATNATFTTNKSTFTATSGATTLSQTVSPSTTYYYRIRANSSSGSSAWKNALPLPIRYIP